MKKNTFSMTIENTPENKEAIEFFQTWSRATPTLYFLDICAVSHIKDYKVKGDNLDNIRKIYIQSLKDIDLEQNDISYFPDLMEKASDQVSNFSTDELIEEAIRDWDAINDFFKKAKLYEPKDFVYSYVQECKDHHPEINGKNYHNFLRFANELGIHNSLSPNKKIKVAKTLCDKANELEISKFHPVVLAVLACIYGCIPAKKIIKFKEDTAKFNSSNAIGDIQIIQRVGILSKAIEDAGQAGKGRYLRAHFFTNDENLKKFYHFFIVNDVKTESNDSGSTNEFNITLKVKYIFPDLYDSNGEFKDDKCKKELYQIYELMGFSDYDKIDII